MCVGMIMLIMAGVADYLSNRVNTLRYGSFGQEGSNLAGVYEYRKPLERQRGRGIFIASST